MNEYKRIKMIEGRINEAKRLASKDPSKQIKIFPYLAIKYQDTYSFLSKVCNFNTFWDHEGCFSYSFKENIHFFDIVHND